MPIHDEFKQSLQELHSLLFPGVCLACGAKLPPEKEILCNRCLYDLPRTHYHLERDNPVEETFWGRMPIVRATSYYHFNKGSKFQKLIHALKYQGKARVGIYLGRQMGQDIHAEGFTQGIDAIIPVPLHEKKRRQRGYNQSDLIAQGIKEATGIPVNRNALLRKVHSSTQTRKTRYDRWENVSRIFDVRPDEKLRGKHVLLIDDVMTTGATLEACAGALQQKLDVRISIATLALA